jgi:hypothetical protein
VYRTPPAVTGNEPLSVPPLAIGTTPLNDDDRTTHMSCELSYSNVAEYPVPTVKLVPPGHIILLAAVGSVRELLLIVTVAED